MKKVVQLFLLIVLSTVFLSKEGSSTTVPSINEEQIANVCKTGTCALVKYDLDQFLFYIYRKTLSVYSYRDNEKIELMGHAEKIEYYEPSASHKQGGLYVYTSSNEILDLHWEETPLAGDKYQLFIQQSNYPDKEKYIYDTADHTWKSEHAWKNKTICDKYAFNWVWPQE